MHIDLWLTSSGQSLTLDKSNLREQPVQLWPSYGSRQRHRLCPRVWYMSAGETKALRQGPRRERERDLPMLNCAPRCPRSSFSYILATELAAFKKPWTWRDGVCVADQCHHPRVIQYCLDCKKLYQNSKYVPSHGLMEIYAFKETHNYYELYNVKRCGCLRNSSPREV
jgi:hypothetical protein